MEKPAQTMRIALFDICGTIYRSNTTFDFLSYSFANNKSYEIYKIIYQSFVWRVLNKVLRQFFGLDLTRVLALRFLKGHKRDELICQVEKFYDNFLSFKINEFIKSKIHDGLSSHNCRVILLSATIDVVAEVIARRLGCKEYYSTQLEYIDGICTGKILKDLLGKKNIILKELGIDNSIEYFYTDDFSDIPVLEKAKGKHIVVYSKYRKRWLKVIAAKRWETKFIEV